MSMYIYIYIYMYICFVRIYIYIQIWWRLFVALIYVETLVDGFQIYAISILGHG